MNWTVPARVDELDRLSERVETLLTGAGGRRKPINQVLLALEEVFVNIASYAYPSGDGTVRVGIKIDRATGLVTLRFEDTGTPFDPLQAPDVDLETSAEQRPAGGLGILLTKSCMDQVTYRREDGTNILTLTKTLPGLIE